MGFWQETLTAGLPGKKSSMKYFMRLKTFTMLRLNISKDWDDRAYAGLRKPAFLKYLKKWLKRKTFEAVVKVVKHKKRLSGHGSKKRHGGRKRRFWYELAVPTPLVDSCIEQLQPHFKSEIDICFLDSKGKVAVHRRPTNPNLSAGPGMTFVSLNVNGSYGCVKRQAKKGRWNVFGLVETEERKGNFRGNFIKVRNCSTVSDVQTVYSGSWGISVVIRRDIQYSVFVKDPNFIIVRLSPSTSSTIPWFFGTVCIPHRELMNGEPRSRAIERLALAARDILQRHPCLPFLLMGDFNTRPLRKGAMARKLSSELSYLKAPRDHASYNSGDGSSVVRHCGSSAVPAAGSTLDHFCIVNALARKLLSRPFVKRNVVNTNRCTLHVIANKSAFRTLQRAGDSDFPSGWCSALTPCS